MAGENASQPGVAFTKTEDELHNQTQAVQRLFFIFQNQIDAGNQTVFNKLNQAVEHAGFAGEVAIKRRFGNANGGRELRGRNTLAAIAGFKHLRQRLKYFFATVPFRGLFFCHVLKYP